MQIAVLSDIHANLEAFRRVLEDIDSRCPGVDEIISLGDTLGYGPEPEACMALLRKSGIVSVQGNHESERVSWDGRCAMRHALEQGQHLLDRSKRHIINTGAVGQPRDGDNRAKYVLWDTETGALTVRFVAYDIQAAMAGFKPAGMPGQYARRLL